jgi:predicted Zn-dependent protease
MSEDRKAWESILEQDPGNPIFIDYGEELRKNGRHSDALLVCLRGLNANPSALKGSLLLSRTYYEVGCTSFAVRELKDLLRKLPDNQVIRRLLTKLAPGLELSNPQAFGQQDDLLAQPDQGELLAETEFAFESLEAFTEDLSSSKKR